MAQTKLSPPWVTYCHMIEKLFEKDDEVNVVFDDDADAPRVKVFIDNDDKYDAWVHLLPSTINIGNVTLSIELIPSNGVVDYADIIMRAFDGNPILADVIHDTSVTAIREWFVMFEPTVVQFQNDDVSNPYGLTTTLYEDIASVLMATGPQVSFTTAPLPTPSKDV